jgi:signal peptidase I
MKYLTIIVLLFLYGCGYAKHVDPPLYTYNTPELVQESAVLHARDVNGLYSKNVCCGSMEPLIFSGDWTVIQQTPFRQELLGRVVVYKPAWNNFQMVMHRLVSGDVSSGFIASGDNNPSSEASERVTATNYIGEVVGIYRLKVP